MNAKNILIIIIVVVLGGAIYLIGSQQLADTNTEEMENVLGEPIVKDVVGQDIPYYGDVKGYLARPDDGGTYPGLVLIHEWWGLNNNIRNLAKDFAQQGYVALAVDLYGGQVAQTPEEAGVLAGAVRENVDEAFSNLNAAVGYLKSLEYVKSDSLASVGWCFGGGWAYEMAKNDLGVEASVMYYGRFSVEDDLSMMRADILGHFGEEDASILIDNVKEFEAKLKTLSGNHAVFIYPNAGHAFANEDNQDAYREDAAKLAWQRTIDFLSRELKSPRTPKDATYIIDGREITLEDGYSEIEIVPGSASKIVTRYFGNEVYKDLDGDGKEDVAFLITQETSGSGTFFYAVGALNKDEGYMGTHGFFLGDRISPQATNSSEGRAIVVNYAVRAEGESFAIQPSIGKSTWLLLDPRTMQFGEISQP